MLSVFQEAKRGREFLGTVQWGPLEGGDCLSPLGLQCNTMLPSGELVKRQESLTIPEAGRPRSGHQHGQGRALFQAASFSLYLHMEERGRELHRVAFIRAPMPFLKASPPNAIALGVRIPTCALRWDTNIQTVVETE